MELTIVLQVPKSTENCDTNALKSERFARLPRDTKDKFKFDSQGRDNVRITIINYDSEGKRNIIAENMPYHSSNQVIVTCTGSLVDAKSLKPNEWLDTNNVDHKKPPCETCLSLRTLCTTCLVDSRVAVIQDSIGVVTNCRVAEMMVAMLEKVGSDRVARKEAEVQDLMLQVQTLAEEYWTLEAKTKRSVRTIKDYGENLKEAAEDFEDDGILKDFWKEMSNMDEATKSLKDANEQHEVIKGKVQVVQAKAKGNAETFEKKAEKAQKYLDEYFDEDTLTYTEASTYLSIPVVGQLLGVAGGAYGAGAATVEALEDTDWGDNTVCKVVGGTLAGTVGLVAGAVTSVITIPAGPYLWVKGITSHLDAKNYGPLAKKFSNIALQMGLIDTHLGKITGALGDIESHLQKAVQAEERVMSTDGKKRAKMVKRVVERAEELIKACDEYFSLAKRDSKAIEKK